MKKVVLFTAFIMACFCSNAQSRKDSTAPYLKVPHIPPFSILLTDSTWYGKKDLPKKTPVVIIYFSPDCSHCQWETKEIVDSMQYFEDAFFVFAAYKNMGEIKEFSEKYKLKDFSNIRVGRDTAYFLPSFYRVKFTPFIAVYDENGNFLQAFPQGAKIEELKALLYNRKKKPVATQ